LAAPRPIELVQIETSGDVVRDLPLSQIGGDGVFTKEIQRALLSNVVDVAVHSLKDLPTTYVEGLTLGAVPPRGATGDVFVSRRHARFDDLPQGAVVATGSLRRRAQALHRRPDLKMTPIRGNVGTRLSKLDEQGLDAIILAQAGLERLGLSTHITEILDPLWMLPAVGQGALGLECRTDDSATLNILGQLNDGPTRQAVLAERALLRGLGGGCLVPIGARAVIVGDRLTLSAAVLAPDGSRRVADETEGPAVDAEQIGQALAERMWEQGARELLAMER
jgi:hydroxymethylbilane synthase